MVSRYVRHLCRALNPVTVFLLLISPVLLIGCATPPARLADNATLYLSPAPASVAGGPAPAYLLMEPSESFNRIGTPSSRATTDEGPEIFVDPEKPTIYFETQEFQTAKGRYTNLVYRIHFQEVPLGWDKINLTAGRNPGLLFIYTLDETGRLLLITTVHTCGCYLAFLPTDAMPQNAFPADWSIASQRVYGHTLPGILHVAKEKAESRIVFTLESETHRVSEVTVADVDTRLTTAAPVTMSLLPMHTLYALPHLDKSVSFFETEGSRAGYVKDNTKILERLLLSWWAFDLHVGEDKAYGRDDKSRTILYTSLKFWDRQASDLNDFPGFLAYWGWRL